MSAEEMRKSRTRSERVEGEAKEWKERRKSGRRFERVEGEAKEWKERQRVETIDTSCDMTLFYAYE